MDLSGMTLAQLKELEQDAARQIKKREKQDREKAIESIYAIAHGIGLPLASLLKAAKAPAQVAIKYRNPDQPEQKWSGKGPRPQWIKDAVAAGRSLDQFLI